MPVLGAIDTGNMTMIVITDVIKIGRNRSGQAFIIASSLGIPLCRCLKIWSISRMAVVMSIPVKMITAMMETLENAWCANHNAKNTPEAQAARRTPSATAAKIL